MWLVLWFVYITIIGAGVTILAGPLVAAVVVFLYALWTQETVLRPYRRFR